MEMRPMPLLATDTIPVLRLEVTPAASLVCVLSGLLLYSCTPAILPFSYLT